MYPSLSTKIRNTHVSSPEVPHIAAEAAIAAQNSSVPEPQKTSQRHNVTVAQKFQQMRSDAQNSRPEPQKPDGFADVGSIDG
jgi:hypothetical protein